MKNATLKQLRALAAVIRRGSVTGAAEALNVSAPAITLQLQSLQDAAGLPLVERSPKGMIATEAGLRVAEAAQRIEAVLSDCAAALAALAGSEAGVVHVGVVSTAKYFAPRALAAFARAHPGIELKLTVGNRADVIEALRTHELDIAIMGRPPEEMSVAMEVIGDHPHVIVAPPHHRLARRRAIAADELANETFLVREPGSGTRALMHRFLAANGVAPRIGMEIGSNETIKQAAIAGLGVAFLSAHTIETEVHARRLVILDIKGLPIIRQWHVAHLAERQLMPAALKLRRFLTAEGKAYLPQMPLRNLHKRP